MKTDSNIQSPTIKRIDLNISSPVVVNEAVDLIREIVSRLESINPR
jgi:hypothetical protein